MHDSIDQTYATIHTSILLDDLPRLYSINIENNIVILKIGLTPTYGPLLWRIIGERRVLELTGLQDYIDQDLVPLLRLRNTHLASGGIASLSALQSVHALKVLELQTSALSDQDIATMLSSSFPALEQLTLRILVSRKSYTLKIPEEAKELRVLTLAAREWFSFALAPQVCNITIPQGCTKLEKVELASECHGFSLDL